MFEGPFVDAGEGGLVADDEGEGAAGVGEVLKGPGESGVGSGEVGRDVAGFFEGVVEEEVGFDGREAAEAPAGGGEGFDEFGFEGRGGGEVVEVGGDEGAVVVGGFGGKEDLFGVEAVLEGVLGRAGEAVGGGGAGGEGSIGSGIFLTCRHG